MKTYQKPYSTEIVEYTKNGIYNQAIIFFNEKGYIIGTSVFSEKEEEFVEVNLKEAIIDKKQEEKNILEESKKYCLKEGNALGARLLDHIISTI